MPDNYDKISPHPYKVMQERKLSGDDKIIQLSPAKTHAQRALIDKMWIFDPVTNDWYTPEEFKEKFEPYTESNQHVVNRIILKNPLDSIDAANERLSKFTKRVLSYYRSI